MDLQERIKDLKEQQEQAKNLFLKLQGAIEFTEGLINAEENKDKKEEKPVVKDKK
jgi:hypothetical protein